MPRIPSRHHYVASVGTAILVGVAFWAFTQLSKHRQQAWLTLVPLVFVAHQWGYLWAVKKGQFDQRARPIEMLLDVVRVNPGQPVHFRCGEYLNEEARRAIRYRLGGEINPKVSVDTVAPAGAIEIPCGIHGPL
jgi:cbb3-type cytochrome oxidase subunit 3